MPNKSRNRYVDQNTVPVAPRLQAAAQLAIHHYLPPSDETAPTDLCRVSPNIDTEILLANAAENLDSG